MTSANSVPRAPTRLYKNKFQEVEVGYMSGGTYINHEPDQVVYYRRTEGKVQQKAQYRNKDGLVIKSDLITAWHPDFEIAPRGKALRDLVTDRLMEEYGDQLVDKLPRGKLVESKSEDRPSIEKEDGDNTPKKKRKRDKAVPRSRKKAVLTEVAASKDEEAEEFVGSMKSSQAVIKWFSDLEWDRRPVSEKEQLIQVARQALQKIMGRTCAPTQEVLQASKDEQNSDSSGLMKKRVPINETVTWMLWSYSLTLPTTVLSPTPVSTATTTATATITSTPTTSLKAGQPQPANLISSAATTDKPFFDCYRMLLLLERFSTATTTATATITSTPTTSLKAGQPQPANLVSSAATTDKPFFDSYRMLLLLERFKPRF
jgi:hypothetical protein